MNIPESGTILVVTLPDGRESLAEVLWVSRSMYDRYKPVSLRVEWLPAQGEFVQCSWSDKTRYEFHPIQGNLPLTPDTPQYWQGVEVPGRWRLLKSN